VAAGAVPGKIASSPFPSVALWGLVHKEMQSVKLTA